MAVSTSGTNQTIDESATEPETAGTRRPWEDGIGVGVAVVIAGALVIMAAYGEVFFDALIFLGVFAALAVWAARRPAKAPRIALAVLLPLFVGINLVYALPDLIHPESPLPFIGSAMVVWAGGLTAVLAGLAARRRRVPAPVWSIAAGALGLVAAGGLLAAAGVQDDPSQAGDTPILARNISYPAEVAMGSGSEAIHVRNDDLVRHTLVVEGQTETVELPAKSSVRVELDLAPGSYRFFCDVVGHDDMQGTLVVG